MERPRKPPDHGIRERRDEQRPEQEAGEDRERFEALASLVLPVDVLQPEPQRELVENECGARPVGDRRDPEAPAARLLVDAGEQQPGVADEQQHHDPEDEVMHVDALDHDSAVGAGAGSVQRARRATRDRECDDEPESREHRTLAPHPEVMMEVQASLVHGLHLQPHERDQFLSAER